MLKALGFWPGSSSFTDLKTGPVNYGHESAQLTELQVDTEMLDDLLPASPYRNSSLHLPRGSSLAASSSSSTIISPSSTANNSLSQGSPAKTCDGPRMTGSNSTEDVGTGTSGETGTAEEEAQDSIEDLDLEQRTIAENSDEMMDMARQHPSINRGPPSVRQSPTWSTEQQPSASKKEETLDNDIGTKADDVVTEDQLDELCAEDDDVNLNILQSQASSALDSDNPSGKASLKRAASPSNQQDSIKKKRQQHKFIPLRPLKADTTFTAENTGSFESFESTQCVSTDSTQSVSEADQQHPSEISFETEFSKSRSSPSISTSAKTLSEVSSTQVSSSLPSSVDISQSSAPIRESATDEPLTAQMSAIVDTICDTSEKIKNLEEDIDVLRSSSVIAQNWKEELTESIQALSKDMHERQSQHDERNEDIRSSLGRIEERLSNLEDLKKENMALKEEIKSIKDMFPSTNSKIDAQEIRTTLREEFSTFMLEFMAKLPTPLSPPTPTTTIRPEHFASSSRSKQIKRPDLALKRQQIENLKVDTINVHRFSDLPTSDIDSFHGSNDLFDDSLGPKSITVDEPDDTDEVARDIASPLEGVSSLRSQKNQRPESISFRPNQQERYDTSRGVDPKMFMGTRAIHTRRPSQSSSLGRTSHPSKSVSAPVDSTSNSKSNQQDTVNQDDNDDKSEHGDYGFMNIDNGHDDDSYEMVQGGVVGDNPGEEISENNEGEGSGGDVEMPDVSRNDDDKGEDQESRNFDNESESSHNTSTSPSLVTPKVDHRAIFPIPTVRPASPDSDPEDTRIQSHGPDPLNTQTSTRGTSTPQRNSRRSCSKLSTASQDRRHSSRSTLNSVNYRDAPLETQYKKDGSVRQRRSFGPVARANGKCLAMSNGVSRGDGKWPEKIEATVKGKMQAIACSACKGNVHWFCAGLEEDELAPEGDWYCPDCEVLMKKGKNALTISTAPPHLCLRGDCILRLKKRMKRVEHDDEIYVLEKLIGRKAISRNEDTSRNFVHLVKWVGWGVQDSTWEPEENLYPNATALKADFNRERDALGLSSKPKVVLLPDAEEAFDEEGELKDKFRDPD